MVTFSVSTGQSIARRPVVGAAPVASAVAAGCVLAAAAGAQTASERLIWAFQTEDRTIDQFITRAPSGVLYIADNTFTYAISPDGELLWQNPDASGDHYSARPISLGADGTLYTGVSPGFEPYAPVIAINPDGTTKWRFVTGGGANLCAGPGVGPDGNIYGVQEDAAGEGLGIFALDPDGNLIWSDSGDPAVPHTELISNSEILFGADRLHAGVIALRSGGNPVYYTFDLDAQQLWTTWDLFPHSADYAVLDPQNRLILPWGQTGMRALAPDGDEEWFALHPDGAQVVRQATVAASGRIYTGDAGGVQLWALEPDGTTRWVGPYTGESLRGLGISPDERVLVVWGSRFAESDWIRGHDPDDGELLWEVQLEPENGLKQFVSSYQAVFTPDSQIVYLTTQFVSASNEYGYLLALRAQDSAGCYADCDESGGLDFFDFLCFQNAFAAGEPYADCDGSGGHDFFDFLCFQNAFAAGCP